ncbi:MAG: 2-hydroxyglutaryl-CoA dehydratase [Dehalococcoidia bacterium]|nr:2-hydroxyglutaryl-CoA dehydratase [Dehalococcoidia bacterium]
MSSHFLGIDIGAAGSKAVIFDGEKILASDVMPSGTNYLTTSAAVKAEVLRQARLKEAEITASAATGIGGRNAAVGSYHGVILCDARGVNLTFPSARTIIDIGGQGSQVITLDEAGKIINFNVSEICATGSARLLQVVARILQVDINDIGPLSLKSTHPSNFSTSCTVFLETEVITRISQGDRPEDILAGIHRSIANKISGMSRGVTLQQDVVIIGGGALDTGLVKAIEDTLGVKALVPENPRIMAALGAAVIARDRHFKPQ